MFLIVSRVTDRKISPANYLGIPNLLEQTSLNEIVLKLASIIILNAFISDYLKDYSSFFLPPFQIGTPIYRTAFIYWFWENWTGINRT